MTETSANSNSQPAPSGAGAMARWAPEGSPVSIEYPLEAMARIRDQAIIGFHRLAKRGIECGGVLYGHREGRRVTILDSRPICCEHKSGPSFVLSDADRTALKAQLAQVPQDLAAPGLVAVGVYISHTKDDLRAAERDVAVYNEFFPDPWQVLLILRPARQGAVRAGFFVREPFGNFRADQSYEEFLLNPPESAAEAAALVAAARQAEQPEAPPPPRPRAIAAAAGAGAGSAAAEFSYTPFQSPFATMPAAPPPSSSALARYDTGIASANEALMARLRQQRAQQLEPVRGERHWSWIGWWLLAILLICAGTYWALEFNAPAPLLLRVSELNGDLRIEWDRSSSAIKRASSASLEIRHGESKRDIALNPEQLALGTYLFTSAGLRDVSIRLSVDGLLIPRVEESVNFVPAAQAGSGPIGAIDIKDQRDMLLIENRKLRTELRRQEERAKAAEDRINQLQQQLQRRNRRKQAP